MRNVFASILAVIAVLGLGSGAVRFAHLTLDHGDHDVCAGTSCHHGGAHEHGGGHDGEDRSDASATVRAPDEPVEPRPDSPMPTTCLLCSVLANHTLGEWPFDDTPGPIGLLPHGVVLTDETTLTTRPAEVPAKPRGPPILS